MAARLTSGLEKGTCQGPSPHAPKRIMFSPHGIDGRIDAVVQKG